MQCLWTELCLTFLVALVRCLALLKCSCSNEKNSRIFKRLWNELLNFFYFHQNEKESKKRKLPVSDSVDDGEG